MKAIKVIGLVLLGLVVLVLVLGLIAPREISAERSVHIAAAPERVFEAISDFNTWDEWSPWVLRDTTTRITPGDHMQGVGASYSWTGEMSGSGTQTITAAKSPWSVNTHISFDGMGEADAQWGLEPAEGGGTNVTWDFKSPMPFPWNAMLMFQNMSGAVGKDFEEGLNNLKTYLERGTSSTTTAYEIQPENNFNRFISRDSARNAQADTIFQFRFAHKFRCQFNI